MKRVFSLALMCLLSSAATVFAQSTKFTATTVEGVEIRYTVNDERAKTCRVGQEGDVCMDRATTGTVTIPEVANGYTVVQLASYCFEACEQITELNLPNTVTQIDNYAFGKCTSLKNMILPSGLTTLGNFAFSECEGLESITIPAGVKTFGQRVFDTPNLKEVRSLIKVPPIVGSDLFYDKDDEAILYVPKGRVGLYRASTGWKNFKFIEEDAGLEEGEMFTAVADKFYSLNFIVTDNDTRSCAVAAGGFPTDYVGKIVVPALVKGYHVTGVADQAFKDCKGVFRVVLPSTVTSIGDEAFAGCENIIIFDSAANVTRIGDRAFQGCTNLKFMGLSDNLQTIGSHAFQGCSSLEFLMLPKTFSIAPDADAVNGCTALDKVISFVSDWSGTTPPITPAALGIKEGTPLYVPVGSLEKYKTAWQTYNNGQYADYVQYLIEGDGPSFTISPSDFNDQNVYKYVKTLPGMDDGVVTFPEMLNITYMDFAGFDTIRIDSIASIRGIERFKNLRTLNLQYKLMRNLLVNSFPLLTTLDCSLNHLQKLDLSKNTALEELNCRSNKFSFMFPFYTPPYPNTGITKLTLPDNCHLRTLYAYNNGLTSIDLSNSPALQELNIYGNSLTALDVSNCPRLEVLNASSNTLTTLDVSNNTFLENLDFSGNKVPVIDVSMCTSLKELTCNNNGIKKLDLSKNYALESLTCETNELTDINLPPSASFAYIRCYNNKLRKLDFSNNPGMRQIYCTNNLLEDLVLTGCPKLAWLYCYNNNLHSLDLSNCTELHQIQIQDNKIMTIDLSNVPTMYTANLGGQHVKGHMTVVDGHKKIALSMPDDFNMDNLENLMLDSVPVANPQYFEHNGKKYVAFDYDTEGKEDVLLLNNTITYDYNHASPNEGMKNKRLSVTVDIEEHFLNLPEESKADGYYMNSIVLPYDVAVPEDAEAYFAKSVDDGNREVTMVIKQRFIPKNTPVVIRSESAGLFAFGPANTNSNTSVLAGNEKDNLLAGQLTEGESESPVYLLGKNSDGKAGFWKQSNTIPAYRAYLPLTQAQQSAAGEGYKLVFVSDPTLGIETIDNYQLSINNSSWYTLDGVKLQGKPTEKGMYIHNGKKYVVK